MGLVERSQESLTFFLIFCTTWSHQQTGVHTNLLTIIINANKIITIQIIVFLFACIAYLCNNIFIKKKTKIFIDFYDATNLECSKPSLHSRKNPQEGALYKW